MSDTSYYAPLDEQSANSIRAKYRLLRSRRSKSVLHAVNQASDGEENLGVNSGMNCEANCEMDRQANCKVNRQANFNVNCEVNRQANCKTNCQANYEVNRQANCRPNYEANPEETEKDSYMENCGASLLRDYTITVRHIQRKPYCGRSAERCNRSEHRRRPSNGRLNKHRSSSAGVRLNHTFNAPANLICASTALFAFFVTLLSSVLFLNCYVHFAWSHVIVPVANCLLAEFSSLIGCWTGQLADFYKRSAAKLSVAFRLFSYLIPFALLVVYFELYDLHFTFLANFHGFLLLYVSGFFLPLCMGYLYLTRASRASGRQRKRRLSSTKSSKSIENQPDHSKCQHHRAALSQINRTISLSLLCLVDYVLVRNGLRILHRARRQELSIAYLVESFVDHLVNYDQPMFNYLPTEEHLPADRLSVLRALTIFSFLKLVHGLCRLWLMEEHCFWAMKVGDPNRSESPCKSTKGRRENVYRSKLRSGGQKEATKRSESAGRKRGANQANQTELKQSSNHTQDESNLEGMFEFSFTAVQPVLLGSSSYAVLSVARPFCHTFTSCLTLTLLGVGLLIITLINLNRMDLLFNLRSTEKLSRSLLRIFLGAAKHLGPNRTPAAKRLQRIETRIGPVQLLNYLVLQSLCDLVFSTCLLVLIGNSTLLFFTLIGQLSFIYLNFKRTMAALS